MISKKILYVIFLTVLFLLLFKPFESNLFNYRFVDEDDNFITGKWMLEGKKLYDDIYFQHQPVASFVSSGIQKVAQPNTLFLLVKRHREFIFALSFVSWALLSIRFGFVAFLSGVIFELIKFSLLGHLFLAESLVVFPVAYLSLVVFTLYSKGRVWKLDYWLIPICLAVTQLTLLPLLPFTLFVFGTCLKRLENKKLFLISSGFVLLVVLFLLKLKTSLFGYVQGTYISNILDYIPAELSKSSFLQKLFFIFLKPFEALAYPSNSFTAVLFVISAAYLLLALLNIKRKTKFILLTFFLPALLNLRPQPINTGYSGFHLLPWLVVFIISTVILIYSLKRKSFKNLGIILTIVIFVFTAHHAYREYRHKPVPFDRWYVNYSVAFDYGQTLKELAGPNDTLFTVPDGSLIYWKSEIKPASSFFYIYEFMYKSDKILQQIRDDIERDFPTYIYYEGDLSKDKILSEYSGNYLNVLKDDKKSWLYIRKEKYNQVTDDEWIGVSRYGFGKVK